MNTSAMAAILAAAWCALCAAPPCVAAERAPSAHPSHRHRLDHSGRRQVGKASVYARKFAGRKMADGKIMKPADDNAASKTLPLGTTARVTCPRAVAGWSRSPAKCAGGCSRAGSGRAC